MFQGHTFLSQCARASVAAAAFALTSASVMAAPDLPGKGVKVQPLKSSIAEETFQTLLVMKALEKLGYDEEAVEAIIEFIAENETIEGAPGLKEEHLPVSD